ncbi:MAG: hypothetical protein KAV00_08795, partial [Phycisphaerae bacterium]|nr:hypothetical protein [Phycisphaerae bacterium]
MGRATSVLLVALAVVVTASLLVLVSGNSKEAGIVPGTGSLGGMSSGGSPINSSADGGYTPLPPDTVRIWDSRKQYGPGLRMTLVEWVDREDWIQVPYGTTGLDLLYDTVLEGENFYLDFAWGNTSAPKLYAKKMADGTPSRRNKLYGVFRTGGLALFTGDTEYVRVLASGPDEATIEFRTSIDRYPQGDQVSRWRVLGGKPWVEITAVERMTMVGMHGESRIVVCPEASGDGQDYLYDSLKTSGDGGFVPADSKMLLDFIMDDDTIWVLMWTPVAGQNQRCEIDPQVDGYHAGWSSIG